MARSPPARWWAWPPASGARTASPGPPTQVAFSESLLLGLALTAAGARRSDVAYESDHCLCMRTTLDLDDTLLRDATSAIARDHLEKNEPVPVYTKTFVVESALRALLREHAARRLSLMFGADTGASAPPRRRAKV